jgi:zinc transporter 1
LALEEGDADVIATRPGYSSDVYDMKNTDNHDEGEGEDEDEDEDEATDAERAVRQRLLASSSFSYHDHEHEHGHEHGYAHKGHTKQHNNKKKKDEKKEKKKKKKHGGHHHDLNFWALLLHFAGDVVSSIFVLVTGLLMHFYRGNDWLKYLDPAASVLIVILIFVSTIGLVKQCTSILLQHVPERVALARLRQDILHLPGVVSVRDLHVWELASDMAIATVHVQVRDASLYDATIQRIKALFHRCGVHSSTIQPELARLLPPPSLSPSSVLHASSSSSSSGGSGANCIQDCDEDWCCAANENEVHLARLPNPHHDDLLH